MIVWIHGGGFVAGDADTDFSAYAAGTGAVIVSISYRLGALGFLNLAGMAPAFPTPYDAAAAVPNVGLLDQQAGLQWAFDNAAAFGADPSHILLSGQSAGGASVLYHLTMPSSYGLFRAALAQSPGAPINSQADAQALAAAVASNLGCPPSSGSGGFAAQLACMRAASVLALQEAAVAAAGTYFLPITLGPSIDGSLVTEAPTLAMLAGRYNANASVVVTETLFEGDALLYLYTNSVVLNASAAAGAIAQFEVMTGVNATAAEAVLPAYAPIEAADGFWNYSSRVWGDGIITCGALWAARGAALHSNGWPVHRLLYNTTISGLPVSFQPAGRASHSTDLPILFSPPGALGPGIAAVAADIHGWITNLAVSGDVNGGPNPPPASFPTGWPIYEAFGASSTILTVNELGQYSTVPGWQEEFCDGWLTALYG